MARRFFDTGRTITADNFFSSVRLAIHLLANGLRYVGTLRKNKSQIPEHFLPNKLRAQFSSIFGFTQNLTLCSYTPKFNKSVVMLSSYHHDEAIEDRNDCKPEIITFYNQNKMGCDAFDQLCANNTCRRRTNRWPFNVFYFMVDAAVQNSYTLFSLEKERRNCPTFRKECIEALAVEMCLDAARIRVEELRKTKFSGLKQVILSTFESLGIQIREAIEITAEKIRGRCKAMACKDNSKHSYKCFKCDQFVCSKHCQVTCSSCLEQANDSL